MELRRVAVDSNRQRNDRAVKTHSHTHTRTRTVGKLKMRRNKKWAAGWRWMRKERSCSLEVICRDAVVRWESSSPLSQTGPLSLGFLLSSSPPAAPTGCPRGSPLQEHHVTTLTPASPSPGQKRGWEPCGVVHVRLGRRRAGGQSPNWGAGTSRRPEGRVRGVSGKMRNRFRLIYFNSVEIHPATASIRITAVIRLQQSFLSVYTSCWRTTHFKWAPFKILMTTETTEQEGQKTVLPLSQSTSACPDVISWFVFLNWFFNKIKQITWIPDWSSQTQTKAPTAQWAHDTNLTSSLWFVTYFGGQLTVTSDVSIWQQKIYIYICIARPNRQIPLN